MPAERDLFLVVHARRSDRLVFGPAQRGQQEGGKDRDNGNHHQQFNQRERSVPLPVMK